MAARPLEAAESPAPGAAVAITGLGLITPLGAALRQTWDALIAGHFIRQHTKSQLPAAHPMLPSVTRLAIGAANEAVAHSGWSQTANLGLRTALVVGTSKGPVDHWISSGSGKTAASLPRGLHEVADEIARHVLPAGGPRLTLSAACASGLHALIRGALLIRSGEADRVLVVAAEASVHPLFVGSFSRLGVLAPEGEGCRPFDQNRAGFLMSEAAAAVCLEAASDGRPLLACVDRFAMGGDASHITGIDSQGRTLRRVVVGALDGRSVDLMHAHGTGTTLNDPIELAACDERSSSEHPSRLYSHKGALGHSLGAAGLISVVLNCEVARRGTMPGNVQTRLPLPASTLSIPREPVPIAVRRSLAIASGFGGATAAVTLTHPS